MHKSSLTTLCYIERGDEYLMMHRVKKEKDVNKDKWVGIGGHFEAGESPEDCLLREAMEETGLWLTSYRLRGIVTFISDIYEDEYMFLYTADKFEGDLSDCRVFWSGFRKNPCTIFLCGREIKSSSNCWKRSSLFSP